MLRFHQDDRANTLLSLLGQQAARPTHGLDLWVLRQCWLRRGLAGADFDAALATLQADELLTHGSAAPMLTPRGYGVIIDELALPGLGGEPAPSLHPAAGEHELRRCMLGFWAGTPLARRPADQLVRAWSAIGERRRLFRHALDVCLRSGHLVRKRGARPVFVTSPDGRHWLAGRDSPPGLDALLPTPNTGPAPPMALTDDTLCRLALGAFGRRPPRTRISAARLTHHLWRNGVPDTAWLRALDALHRFGHVDLDMAAKDALLTRAGHVFARQLGTWRQRIRYGHAVRQLRPKRDTPHERF